LCDQYKAQEHMEIGYKSSKNVYCYKTVSIFVLEPLIRLLKRAISAPSDEESVLSDEPPKGPRSFKDLKITTIQEKLSNNDRKDQDHSPGRRRSSTPPGSTQRSSIASDKIPVIKISKTESEECILEKKDAPLSERKKSFKDAVKKQIEEQKKERHAIQKSLYGKKPEKIRLASQQGQKVDQEASPTKKKETKDAD